MSEKIVNFKEKVQLLSEDYTITETENGVILEGLAITFGKPTRNRVSYTYSSGVKTHKSLVGKPFLDSHIDKSIHLHPPFGHVIETWMGTNPKNNLPALFYKVDIDPMEETFIRKVKRKDISGVSVQVLVDSVQEMQDMYGDYIQANIREFLELSAVLIPGDGDTTMKFVESFNNFKSNLKEDLDTGNGNAVINTGGVLPTRKVIRKDPESEEPKETKEEAQNSKSKIFEPNPIVEDEDDMGSNLKLKSKKMESENSNASDKYEERFTKVESLIESISSKLDNSMSENLNQIKQLFKEELKGVPERETGHEKKDIGPENTDELPQTTQPANGEAPSGGTIYGNDKKGTNSEVEAPKPKSDYSKPTVQKNSMDEARVLIEQAKSIMKEYAKGDDVNAPQPGRTESEPETFDVKKKTDASGFTEATEDKEEEKKEEKKDDKNPIEKMYESLQNEIKSESLGRKSTVTIPMAESLSGKSVQNSVQEYLNKTKLNTLIYNK